MADGTKPLHKPIFIVHWLGSVAYTESIYRVYGHVTILFFMSLKIVLLKTVPYLSSANVLMALSWACIVTCRFVTCHTCLICSFISELNDLLPHGSYVPGVMILMGPRIMGMGPIIDAFIIRVLICIHMTMVVSFWVFAGFNVDVTQDTVTSEFLLHILGSFVSE